MKHRNPAAYILLWGILKQGGNTWPFNWELGGQHWELIAGQQSCGCPIPGNAQCQTGWCFEPPGLVEGVSTHGRGIGTRWSLRSPPTELILWWCCKSSEFRNECKLWQEQKQTCLCSERPVSKLHSRHGRVSTTISDWETKQNLHLP